MRRLLLALFLLWMAPVWAAASPHAHIRLEPDRLSVAPGDTLTVAVVQTIAPGWHTYWSNPGEAGFPTTIAWTLPDGWQAGAIQWPYPRREQVGPLMDYGYTGTVWLLSDVAVPDTARPGTMVRLTADVSWLACSNVCVPERAQSTIKLFVDAEAAKPDAIAAGRFAAARAKLPASPPGPLRFEKKNGDLRLYLAAPSLTGAGKPVSAAFFPARAGTIVDAAPQTLERVRDGLVVAMEPASGWSGKTLDGVLVLTAEGGAERAFSVRATPGMVPASSVHTLDVPLALLFAFLGGLILNVMPCVLPVLAMKALALTRQNSGPGARARLRREAFAYCVGAVVSFVLLGFLVAALRASGDAIGWGFQLQEPVVVSLLALLMFAVGLNFSGLFEINPVTVGDALTRKSGLIGAFFTGILAVAVAAPCSAPFMASAVGFALTEDAPVILGIFTALGVGFVLPFLLIGLAPALSRLLPKPGAWMVWFRKLMALPMYGAALWLLWVLNRQVDAVGVVLTLCAALCLGFALWLFGRSRGGNRLTRRAGVVVALIGVVVCALAVDTVRPLPRVRSELPHAAIPYTAARLAAFRAENRPVFVDATASWCITCLVNEQAALRRTPVMAAFKRMHMKVLIADWTNKDPEVTKLLDAHGRSGVPLYLYYAPGAQKPVVLPQILTPQMVLDAIEAEKFR